MISFKSLNLDRDFDVNSILMDYGGKSPSNLIDYGGKSPSNSLMKGNFTFTPDPTHDILTNNQTSNLANKYVSRKPQSNKGTNGD